MRDTLYLLDFGEVFVRADLIVNTLSIFYVTNVIQKQVVVLIFDAKYFSLKRLKTTDIES